MKTKGDGNVAAVAFCKKKKEKKVTTTKLSSPFSLRCNKKKKKEGLQGRELTLKLEALALGATHGSCIRRSEVPR